MSGHRVFLGLGSNLGCRESNLYLAVRRLEESGIRLVRASSIYETEPFGRTDQPLFLNTVVEVRTDLEPEELLKAVKAIENLLGRRPGPRWGPRSIDIDILLYDDLRLQSKELVIPHRGLSERAFVLVPLQEIAPEVNIGKGLDVESALNRLGGTKGIRKYSPWRDDHGR